ncbi:MAG: amidohydrolase family protein, partial [Gemmatimonadaceae bacterium]
MRKYSRGEFLSLSAMLAGAAALAKVPFGRLMAQPRMAPVAPEAPDLIVVNGRVLTMDPALPRAEAFAVTYNRFVAVGSNSDIRNLATRTTPVIDAAGMTVVPGFIDCHCHPRGINELYEVNANVRSVKEIQDGLRKKVATTPP